MRFWKKFEYYKKIIIFSRNQRPKRTNFREKKDSYSGDSMNQQEKGISYITLKLKKKWNRITYKNDLKYLFFKKRISFYKTFNITLIQFIKKKVAYYICLVLIEWLSKWKDSLVYK